MKPNAAAAASLLAMTACSGGSAGPVGPTTAVRSVGGDYTMAVALGENGCGAVTVQPLPTSVTHATGAPQFRLTHGPVTYNGAFDDVSGGAFRTAALLFEDATSSQTVHIQGRFTATGFSAVVTVDRTVPAPVCRYLVNWTGTKVGAANVIP